MNPDIIVESFGLQPGMKVADFGSGRLYGFDEYDALGRVVER